MEKIKFKSYQEADFWKKMYISAYMSDRTPQVDADIALEHYRERNGSML